jgi:hypothetical protein
VFRRKDVEPVSGFLAQDRFGQYRARRISGADKDDVGFAAWRLHEIPELSRVKCRAKPGVSARQNGRHNGRAFLRRSVCAAISRWFSFLSMRTIMIGMRFCFATKAFCHGLCTAGHAGENEPVFSRSRAQSVLSMGMLPRHVPCVARGEAAIRNQMRTNETVRKHLTPNPGGVVGDERLELPTSSV